LSRYAAYLVAMNGDPGKLEVAQAQAYFAVKAREAEVSQQRHALPQSFAEALELAAAQQRQIEAHEVQLAIAAPKVAIADQFLVSDDTIYLSDLAKNLKITRHRLIGILRDESVLFLDELQYRAGYEDWFEVVMDWVDRLGQYKPALKVTRLGVRKIYELLVDREYINPDRRSPSSRPGDNRP
jgi:DNA-damage-inducible protein D